MNLKGEITGAAVLAIVAAGAIGAVHHPAPAVAPPPPAPSPAATVHHVAAQVVSHGIVTGTDILIMVLVSMVLAAGVACVSLHYAHRSDDK